MHVFAQLMKRFTNAKLKSRNLCFIWKIRSLENVLFYLKAGIVREKRSDIAATCTHHKMFFFLQLFLMKLARDLDCYFYQK